MFKNRSEFVAVAILAGSAAVGGRGVPPSSQRQENVASYHQDRRQKG